MAAYRGYDEEFGPETPCLPLLCFRCPLEKPKSRTGYRSLRHEDGDERANCWQEGVRRARRFLSKITPRLRWRALLSKIRRCSRNRRRKPVFRYDSTSYKLNFDECNTNS
ncbi:unnamed protein product [Musa banksii]